MALATGTEFISAATPSADSMHYRIDAKMVALNASSPEIPSGPWAGIFTDDFVEKLMDGSKANTLCLPTVERAELFPSHIGITQQIALPHAKTHETGINFDVVPQKEDAGILFRFSIENVQFQGFVDRAASKPVFHTASLSSGVHVKNLEILSGYYCFNLPPSQVQLTTYDADGRKSASIADANERQLLFVKITRG